MGARHSGEGRGEDGAEEARRAKAKEEEARRQRRQRQREWRARQAAAGSAATGDAGDAKDSADGPLGGLLTEREKLVAEMAERLALGGDDDDEGADEGDGSAATSEARAPRFLSASECHVQAALVSFPRSGNSLLRSLSFAAASLLARRRRAAPSAAPRR